MKSRFLSDLDCRCIDDSYWLLLNPLIYSSHIFGGIITAPTDFRTDLASVPRVPFAYEAFGGRAHKAAVIHDFLYQHHLVSKHRADRIFLEAMKVCKIKLWVRYGMYFGVMFGGQSSYNSGPDRASQFSQK